MDFAWVAAAAALALLLQRALRDALRVPGLVRVNYAGRDVPTGGGVIAVAALVIVAAPMLVIEDWRANDVYRVLVVALGFGLVGFVDDVVGTHAARGLRGHLAAARAGRLTSGAAKLAVGIAVAVVAVVPFTDGAERQVLEVLLVAGAANVANLFDLAPARATKAAALALVPLVVLHRPTEPLVGALCFAAAVAALAFAELREELMLGDAGANPLGAVTGLAFAVAAAGRDAWLYPAVAVVIGLNAAAELVSFSRVIERVPPLRMLDRLGRRR